MNVQVIPGADTTDLLEYMFFNVRLGYVFFIPANATLLDGTDTRPDQYRTQYDLTALHVNDLRRFVHIRCRAIVLTSNRMLIANCCLE